MRNRNGRRLRVGWSERRQSVIDGGGHCDVEIDHGRSGTLACDEGGPAARRKNSDRLSDSCGDDRRTRSPVCVGNDALWDANGGRRGSLRESKGVCARRRQGGT